VDVGAVSQHVLGEAAEAFVEAAVAGESWGLGARGVVVVARSGRLGSRVIVVEALSGRAACVSGQGQHVHGQPPNSNSNSN
jgi:hypothetical protein